DRTVSFMATTIFGPVFFASIGLALDLGSITAAPLFVGLLLLAAFAGKFLGAGGASLACGLSTHQSSVIAIGMNARGAVELVVVQIAATAGLFAIPTPPGPIVANLYHGLVLMAVVTTIATPLLLRLYFHGNDGTKTF
ncbi:MAG: cation:proton antiporter, partial [Alphaproteobacteria bacterium]